MNFDKYMKTLKCNIVVLLLLANLITLRAEQQKVYEIKEIRITNDSVMEILTETVIPYMQKDSLDSSLWDIYLDYFEIKSKYQNWNSNRYDYTVEIVAEMSNHILWSVEDADGYCTFAGYTIFVTSDFRKKYCVYTGNKRSFLLDYSRERVDDYDSIIWKYYVEPSVKSSSNVDKFTKWGYRPYKHDYSHMCRKHALHFDGYSLPIIVD